MATGGQERVAIVTGGGRGIGASIVEHLAATGLTVSLWDLPEVIAAYEPPASVRDGSILLREVDVGDEGQVDAAVADLTEAFGGVDVLVNNAGISPKVDGARVPPLETSTEEWHAVIRVNLTGPFFCSRAAGRVMKERGRGRIINISSGAARQGARLAGLSYGATKAGINGITKTLAHELAPHGVTVNSICPGRIQTPMAEMIPAEVNERLIASIPVGRVGEGHDIAALVAFLASDDASFITGGTFDVNGGSYIAP